MKRRRYWRFTSDAESWWGDCPQWAASVRRSRPDLTVTVGVMYGQKSICPACLLGVRH